MKIWDDLAYPLAYPAVPAIGYHLYQPKCKCHKMAGDSSAWT